MTTKEQKQQAKEKAADSPAYIFSSQFPSTIKSKLYYHALG